MFTNPKILKKLMKEAWKANFLIVGKKRRRILHPGQLLEVHLSKRLHPENNLCTDH